MILIADSGSTKCDWALIQGDDTLMKCVTIGFNPFFHTSKFISDTINKKTELFAISEDVKYVFLFCAGGSNTELKRICERALKVSFPNANVYVDHDLVAAAFATYTGVPAISCILGTGSNSCFFDGDIVEEKVPALAYILGDEASGTYFGKQLLALFLYNKLPEDLMIEFAKKYPNVDKTYIFENVYMKPNANVFLASFMKFLQPFKNDNFINNMLKNGFREFFKIHILCFDNYKEIPVHFVGSIAYYYSDILKEVAKEFEVSIDQIMKKPIEGLVNYYSKNYNNILHA